MLKIAPLLPARSVSLNNLQKAILAGDGEADVIAKACGEKIEAKQASKPKTTASPSAKADKKG